MASSLTGGRFVATAIASISTLPHNKLQCYLSLQIPTIDLETFGIGVQLQSKERATQMHMFIWYDGFWHGKCLIWRITTVQAKVDFSFSFDFDDQCYLVTLWSSRFQAKERRAQMHMLNKIDNDSASIRYYARLLVAKHSGRHI